MKAYVRAMKREGIAVEKICPNRGVKEPIIFFGIKDLVVVAEDYRSEEKEIVSVKKKIEEFSPVKPMEFTDPYSIECPVLESFDKVVLKTTEKTSFSKVTIKKKGYETIDLTASPKSTTLENLSQMTQGYLNFPAKPVAKKRTFKKRIRSKKISKPA